MSDKFARLLLDQEQVNQFLSISLGVNLDEYPDVEYEIIKSETGIANGLLHPTFNSNRYRDRRYTDENTRLALRKQIVEELFTLNLIEDDDVISLGIGGAVPTLLQYNKQAFILIGLPASGKSSVAAKLANHYGAMIIDSDFAKRKLPEFLKYPWGASIVHKESSEIVFGDRAVTNFDSLYDKAIMARSNIIIPKIGADSEDIVAHCKSLQIIGYTIHLTLVYLPKEKSAVRALKRFHQSKRYVPLARIFDVYGNNSALTYFEIKNRQPDYIHSYGVINTDVSIGNSFVCTDLQGDNPADLYPLKENALI